MVNGQDKLVQGGEGEKGGGGEETRSFLLLLPLLLFCFNLFIITFLFFHNFILPMGFFPFLHSSGRKPLPCEALRFTYF